MSDFTISDAEVRGLISTDPELQYLDAHAAWVRDGKPYRGWRSYLGTVRGCGYVRPEDWKVARGSGKWSDPAKAARDGESRGFVRWYPF